jgi:hypothetical protein
MTISDIKELLMADLEKLTVPAATSKYLDTLITVAIAEIQREGITLKTTADSTETVVSYDTDDSQTIEMYAAYLYRKRADGDNGMPRMLRYRLNNRVFSQKASEA